MLSHPKHACGRCLSTEGQTLLLAGQPSLSVILHSLKVIMGDEYMPHWKGLFDWSMQYQDGTRPTDFSAVDANPEKIRWCALLDSNGLMRLG